jgi:TRAP-type C4-dicarboxylate transport system substrate-binding protein
MKKAIFFSLSIVMLLLIGAGTSWSKAEFDIKFSTYISPNMADSFRNMAKNIEEMSEGKIKVTVFAGGELVSSSDVLKAVRAGTLQMAMGSPYHYEEMKTAGIEAGMPMTWANAVESEVLWENMGFGELVSKAYEEVGVHYLGPIWAAPYAITTKSPVNGLVDLQKMKLRATSGPAKMFKKLGITTVYMKPEEMYLALSTGQIDGVLYGGAAEYAEMSFQEVAPYYCSTYILNPITDAMFINKKLWESLPENLKAVIESAAYKARWEYYSWAMGQEFKAQDTVYKGKTYSFGADDIAKLTDAAQEIWDEEAKASPLAAQMVDKVKALLRSVGRLK